MIGNIHKNDLKIETIENENGTAIKFSDGTMICRGQVVFKGVTFTKIAESINYSEQQTISFPQEFISDNDISISATCRTGNFAWVSNVLTTTTGFTFHIMHTTNVERDVFVTWSAIGRWK